MSTQKLIPPPPSSDLLIHSLKHHAPDNSDPNTYALCKNPFEEINASEELSKGQKVLDYDSEPDSEAEDALYETQWGDADQEFAEPQTIDHEMEYSDIVDRAGAYTGEEILKISIEKATKLHSLYCSQLNQLRQIYIDKKRQYLQDLKKEKELYCSIHNQKKTSVEEMRRYKLLKASISYGRKHRLNAILAKREHEKRLGGKQPSKSKMYKCYFQDDGVRCFAVCIPLTKFCARHILMDKRQVLFRACGAPFNNTTCTNPVLVTVKDKYCTFHRTYRSVLEREQREMIETMKNEVQNEVKTENGVKIEVKIENHVKTEDVDMKQDEIDVDVTSEDVKTKIEVESKDVKEEEIDVITHNEAQISNEVMKDDPPCDVIEEGIEYHEESVMEETVEEETVQEQVVEDHIVYLENE